MAGGDANVNFDMDRLNKQAEAEKRKAEKLDKSLDSLNASIAKMQQKDFMGLLRGAQKQYAQVAAAGGTARAAMMPAYSFQTYTPPAPTLPTPRLTVAQQFRLFRPGGTGGGAQGGGAAWGGMALPPIPPAVAPAGAAAGNINLNGLQGAIRGASSLFKQVSSDFAASVGPFSTALTTATAGLALFGNALQFRQKAAAESSEFFGGVNVSAGRAAVASGGSASRFANKVNGSADVQGAIAFMNMVASHGPMSGKRRISPAMAERGLDAINAGADPMQVQAAVENGNVIALAAQERMASQLSPDARAEMQQRRETAIAEENARLSAPADAAELGRLRPAQLERWKLQHPGFSWVPDMFLFTGQGGVSPGLPWGAATFGDETGLSVPEMRAQAAREQGAYFGAPTPQAGTPTVSPHIAVPQPPFNPAHSGRGPNVGSIDHAASSLLQVAQLMHANVGRRASPYWANPNSNPA